MATLTYTGGGANLASDPNNWDTLTMPQAGDDIVFPDLVGGLLDWDISAQMNSFIMQTNSSVAITLQDALNVLVNITVDGSGGGSINQNSFPVTCDGLSDTANVFTWSSGFGVIIAGTVPAVNISSQQDIPVVRSAKTSGLLQITGGFNISEQLILDVSNGSHSVEFSVNGTQVADIISAGAGNTITFGEALGTRQIDFLDNTAVLENVDVRNINNINVSVTVECNSATCTDLGGNTGFSFIVVPGTMTWTGGDVGDLASAAANWDLNRTPITGDTLVWPAGATGNMIYDLLVIPLHIEISELSDMVTSLSQPMIASGHVYAQNINAMNGNNIECSDFREILPTQITWDPASQLVMYGDQTGEIQFETTIPEVICRKTDDAVTTIRASGGSFIELLTCEALIGNQEVHLEAQLIEQIVTVGNAPFKTTVRGEGATQRQINIVDNATVNEFSDWENINIQGTTPLECNAATCNDLGGNVNINFAAAGGDSGGGSANSVMAQRIALQIQRSRLPRRLQRRLFLVTPRSE